MKELIPILCDPITKEELNIAGETLKCNGSTYPIIQDVPLLIKDDAIANAATSILNSGKSSIAFSWALSHWHDLQINTLLEQSQEQGSRLLNFGSGSPAEKKEMEKKGYKVVALDINAKYKGVDVIGDGHQLPFKNHSFQAVTAFEVLEHLHSPWVAIREINRVLPVGGKFVGSVAFLKEFHESYFHMSHWGVISLLEGAGFKIEKIYGGQNILSRLVSSIIPLGPSKFSSRVYDFIYRTVMKTRKWVWERKTGENASKPLKKFDTIEFSFEQWDQLKFSPTVLFRAVKIQDLG